MGEARRRGQARDTRPAGSRLPLLAATKALLLAHGQVSLPDSLSFSSFSFVIRAPIVDCSLVAFRVEYGKGRSRWSAPARALLHGGRRAFEMRRKGRGGRCLLVPWWPLNTPQFPVSIGYRSVNILMTVMRLSPRRRRVYGSCCCERGERPLSAAPALSPRWATRSQPKKGPLLAGVFSSVATCKTSRHGAFFPLCLLPFFSRGFISDGRGGE